MLEEMQGFRLSPQQKHLWQLQETDNFPYRSQCAVVIEGNLDISRLQLALEKVVKRHEILRTNFHCLPGMTVPFQVIKNHGISWGENYDLSSCSQIEQQELLFNLFAQLGQKIFDFEQDSLLRLSLITLSPYKHVLFISLPALCADARTLKILVEEISQSYAACVDNEELEDEPLQYADLAEWQNELLEGEDTEAGRDYWRKQDISSITKLRLPGERKTAKNLEFLPKAQKFVICGEILQQLEKITQQYNTSISDFLLACWQVLLYRLTKQQSLIIGLGVEGRKYQDLESALGLFAKYLPLEVQLQPEYSILDILQQNFNNQNNIYKFQEYFNWEQITVSTTNIPRFFSLCFEFLEQVNIYVNAGVSFKIEQQYTCIERFKIKLQCLRQNQTITAALHYDSNLFQIEDIQRLAGQFETLLASAIAHPHLPISQLDILSQNEKQLLNQVNQTKQEYPLNKCIHQLFEKQVQKTPNHIAVVFENQQLTYTELNLRANQLAHYLQKQGVQPEVLVGLCVDRSLEMIVGLLGILKAGAAYVPLDPALPTAALASRLQDSQVSLLLSHSSLAHKFADITTISLDKDWETIAEESDANASSQVTSQNLAYVLFTSGSTGKAKGVAVEHQQLLNYVNAIINRLNLSECQNFAMVSTLAADLGNTVLFPALCIGGCLHIISYERSTDPTAFAEYCQRYPIDCLKIVPAHINSLLLSSTPETVVPRQRLVLGGETVSWQLIEQIKQYTSDCQIFNHYGPTEATVGVLTHPVEISRELFSQTVPLGKPLANTQVYVLEQQLQLAPIGVKGEVYIGGAGLARCYQDQPELTAVKFIPNPFSEEPGTRLYKTGDLGCYLPDGTIEFLGRSDYQVKIRGFRIELAEIETALVQHPLVRETVVVAREEASGEKRLVAYLVPQDESLLQKAQLTDWRSFLSEKLPDYMIPASFVILPALPLTSNGKVNRQELPAPEEEQRNLDVRQTPRTPIEEVIAGIWSQILNLEKIGIDDNFFELGGHSLLATQVASKIREALQVDLPLRSLFELPTVAALAEHIEKLLNDSQAVELPPIQPVGRDRLLPLSFAQARLWFLEQWQPGSSYYNFSIAVRLQGLLNIAALEQSLNEIVRRHEALRTTFTVIDEQPVQQITPAWSIKLPIVDLRELPSQARIVETQRLAKLEAQQALDLTNGPLLNTILVQQEDDDYVLLFTIHHIISDAWSTGVIVRELTALYEAYCSGKSSPLAELPIQYADFAVWQRECLQQEVLASQMDYWKQLLGGSLPVLELPSDRPRPPIQTSSGKRQAFQLSASLTQALKTLSQQQGVTLFMTLLAAFQTLLYRYTGQEDILVGSPIANRNRSEIEGLIGFFVNTLVLRTDLSGNPSFSELLKRVREVTLGAYTHQDLPFEQLVEELQPERNLSYSPLFQVMFALQNTPLEELKLSGLTINLEEIDTETSRFDLTLLLTENNQGLMGVLEYNSDLFDADTISRMQGHFQTLLVGILTNPHQQLSNLPILTATEKQLLLNWNNTEIEYPSACIHQLFEAQVEKTPDAVAVVFENEQLTYRELNQRANQLAHYLQKLGVKPEVLVGICVERSLEMVIGLLAILKAGGAYVPLDPAYPQERLAYMLADSQVSVLLTQERLLENLPSHNAQVVCLDQDRESLNQHSTDNLNSGATSHNLAYVIYTSGSTGQPKGVLVTHANVARLFSAVEAWYHFNEQDVWTLFHSYAFDFSVWEMWGALLYGGRLVVVSYWMARSPEAFYQLLSQERVTVLNQTPSAFHQLIRVEESLEQIKELNLRLVIFGGESLDIQSLQPWFERHGDRFPQLVNMYGITETTVHVTYRPLTMADLDQTASVIGKPIPDLQIYILDQHQQLLPMGVPGEIYIGGAGLARGYLNRPELTQERFIPHPFSEQPDARLYKSGDLGRYLPNGDIEFLGRIDNQVKIRGFRIEIGEIEAAINQHPLVQASVVVVREDELGDQRLVAYVVFKPEQTLVIAELRRFLAEKVPNYMLPAAFVALEKLPLTLNGKVDRRALPAPETTRIYIEEVFVAPRNVIEEAIAQIWQEILGVEQVGVNDNFFELGGHSLLATQVISRLRNTLEIDLLLRYLFESPTVAEFAKTIQEKTTPKLRLNAAPIQRVARDANIPLSFAQARLWLLEQLHPGSNAYNISAAVRLCGELNITALEQSLNEVISRHEVLRTQFSLVNGQAFQSIAPSLSVQFPIIDLCNLPAAERAAEVERLAIAQSRRTFDLTQLPLLRCTLLHLDEQEYVVLLTMHHIVSDGWSMGVFIQELATLYAAFCAGKASPLPELPIQYADFAVWQRQWLQGEVLQTQLDYWQQQLKNLPILELPTDFPRPPQRTFRGAKQTLVLDNSLSQTLKKLSTATGVTLFMTLLAGFQTLLHWYTNQDDIVVGTDVANRNQAETESLIGFFVNQLVLRTDMARNPSFRELLERVSDRTLSAYTHQDLPFDKLVEVLNPERDLSRAPLFQVKCILQNAPMPALELPGLKLSLLDMDKGVVEFDLLLILTDTEKGLIADLKYSTDLFKPTTVSRLLKNLEIVLNTVVQQPSIQIADIKKILDSANQQQHQAQAQEYQKTLEQKFMKVKRKSISTQRSAEDSAE